MDSLKEGGLSSEGLRIQERLKVFLALIYLSFIILLLCLLWKKGLMILDGDEPRI